MSYAVSYMHTYKQDRHQCTSASLHPYNYPALLTVSKQLPVMSVTALELHQCSPSEAVSVTDFVRYGHAECLAQRNYH